MATSTIILHLICLLLWREVHFAPLSVQQEGVMAVVGSNVSLQCFDRDQEFDDMMSFYLYKHSLGDKPPELLASQIRYKGNATLSDTFMKDSRFSLASGEGIHVKILDVQLSDSAMYYCGIDTYNTIIFKEGSMLHVKGSSIQAIVQHPPDKMPGELVTLNCTVHTASTYHCAESVASGGGAGGLNIGMGVALVISIILVIVLSSIIYKLKRETYGHSGPSAMCPTNAVDQDEDNLHYAAVSFSKKSRPRPQRSNVDTDTVYAGVRQ